MRYVRDMNRPSLDGTGGLDALIGGRLAQIRAERSIPQTDIAAGMAVLGHKWTRPTVSGVEHGRRNLSLDEVADLVRVLRVRLGDLLDIDGQDIDETTAMRARALVKTTDVWGDWPQPDVQPVDDARRAAQLHRLQENVWRALKGGHPSDADRRRLDVVADSLWGQDWLTERDERVQLALQVEEVDYREIGVIAPRPNIGAHNGHATRAMLADVREALEDEFSGVEL